MLQSDVRAFNATLGRPFDSPSGILSFPDSMHISWGDRVMLDRQQRDGLYTLACEGFEDHLVAMGVSSTGDLPATGSPEGPSPLTEANAEVQPMVVDECDDSHGQHRDSEPDPAQSMHAPAIDVISTASIPASAKERPFQRKTAAKIVASPGLHLVKAPPGCGKTAIIAE
eukprot:1948501-Prymnesium_polylepis.1